MAKVFRKTGKPPIEMMRAFFEYEPETGLLYRRSLIGVGGRPTKRRLAGSSDSNGYLQTYLKGYRMRNHQAIFAMHHGFWCEGHIDHINGDRSDNRIANLRCCSASQNMANQKKDNVSRHNDKFRAQLMHDGRRISLGVFDTFEEARAISAYADIFFNKAYARNESRKIVLSVIQDATPA